MIVIKRIFDFALAAVALGILMILGPLIFLIIRLDSKGPAIFKQKRIGKNGKTFTIYKLRTMAVGSDKIENYKDRDKSEVCENDSRVTKVGRVLRKWKIDELPQLFNVLKGDMSIVGPRPELPLSVEIMSEYHKKRLLMKPGCTAYTVITGGFKKPWLERCDDEVWYVKNWSLFLDIKIILLSFYEIFRQKNLTPNNKHINDS